MLELIFDNTSPEKIRQLNEYAYSTIQVRGNNPRYHLPSDFANSQWFLPFNEIALKYCPTDRYSYLHKYETSATRKETWESLKGKILDELYDIFIKKLHDYLHTTSLTCTDIQKDFQSFNEQFLATKHAVIESNKSNLLNPPKNADIENFEKFLKQILRYETQFASSLIDYKISMNTDLNLSSTVLLLFPFVRKPTFTVTNFGITQKAQPDFLYNNQIIMDVKSPPWEDQFYHTLGGYALAIEKANNTQINLGAIIMPEFSSRRNVPFYFRSEIVVIGDTYRKAFLLRRENLLELMKSQKDPGLPSDTTFCSTCPYYTHCFPPS